MDTVRVFSRYDFEEVPTVWVGGEVFRPGSYRTPGQVHLREAVHLAGGLTPYSQLESAQVFRTMPDGTMKVFSVSLAAALAGHAADNIPLLPRDRLLIHANPSKTDPATVSVKGEVVKPGRYPLTANMRVSDLVRAAGGLKRGAFAETADLTRFVAADGLATAASRVEIQLQPALAGDDALNLALRDGDVLGIRQAPGWADLGSSVTVSGEVTHPGVYGIQPGETLTSVLRRAGGLRNTAFPQGSVLEREEVRQLNERSRQDLIRRVEGEAEKIEMSLASASPEQKVIQQAALAQRYRILEQLRGAPASARLALRLGPGAEKLAGSAHDIELRDGDRLTVPKLPGHVMVMGQVYNPTALAFERRKNAGWYIERAGGVTKLAEKKDTFIIRANGTVETSGNGWWGSGIFSTSVQPGDVIVVPEKPLGESPFWKNTLAAAQIVGSLGLTAVLALRR
jgi:protein involved in polysaccharide export with SLBB domain